MSRVVVNKGGALGDRFDKLKKKGKTQANAGTEKRREKKREGTKSARQGKVGGKRRGAGGERKGGEKKKPVTAADLDAELDKYALSNQDKTAAKEHLDAELEEYNKKRDEAAAAK